MRVYLSSTLNDLGPERQAVKDALGGECIVVESYSADERSIRDSCRKDVASCDLYVGIIGLRYGFVPPGETRSITELEYEAALEHKRPTWVFVKNDSVILASQCDAHTKEHSPDRVEGFRKRVMSGARNATRPAHFRTPDDLKSHILKALLSFSRRNREREPQRIHGRPYPGLRAFRIAEADRFFGRDAETDALLDRLLAKGERFLALVGASGSGKSSLVYAGLIPKLTASPVVAGACWFPVCFSPRELGDDPFLALASALKNNFPNRDWHAPALAQRLREQPAEIGAITEEALHDAGANAQALLFVDQFEEVFANKVDIAARHDLFRLLAAAVASPRLRVVIAMRADFYAQWPQDEDSIALLRAGHFPVGVPSPTAIEKMITGPAKAAGLTIPSYLVQRILEDTGTAPGALALAEFALAQLYEKREEGALTEAAYESIGGVAGAINGLAEEAVNNTGSSIDEEIISRLFLAIASVEDGGPELAVVRRRALKSELQGTVLALAEHLVNKRLLVSSRDTGDQLPVYEVGHEAVFSHWGRFKNWYARYAEDLAVRRQAERAAADWGKAGGTRTLRWGWERQKPALEAIRKLSRIALPAPDANWSDPGIAAWRILEPTLSETRLRSFLRPEPLALLEELQSDATPHDRREEIGLRLNALGDPRRGTGLDPSGTPDIVWINVPSGSVRVITSSNEKRYSIASFRLAQYPVTWSQYGAFLDAEDGYCRTAWWAGQPRKNEPGERLWSFDNYPVIRVSWYDALAFCRWLSAKLSMAIRLPTEWEWQWAAEGAEGLAVPWSDDWNPARSNTLEAGIGRTAAVGLYPVGSSPFGLHDMSGNVWEWCLNTYDEPSSVSLEGSIARVLRGGSWLDSALSARSYARGRNDPGRRDGSVGFRVLCESPIG